MRRRVLIIDDDTVSLQVAEAVLPRADFEVRTATGVTALATAFREWVPDVILLDIRMPDVDGVEVCRALKRHYDSAHLTIVLFSATPTEVLAGMAERCEADGFVSKLSGFHTLPDELDRVLRDRAW